MSRKTILASIPAFIFLMPVNRNNLITFFSEKRTKPYNENSSIFIFGKRNYIVMTNLLMNNFYLD